MNIEGSFDATALRILRAIPELAVTAGSRAADRGADAILCFGSSRARVGVETRQRANAATAWQLVHSAQARLGVPLLIIAGETTADARKILADHGIGLLDALGNAHIKLPGLVFHLEGKRSPRRTRPTRLSGKAGAAVRALLLRPQRVWQVKELAAEAHLSLGLAHRVLVRLEYEKAVVADGAGPNRTRRVFDLTSLLDLWAEEHTDRPVRTLGHLLAQSPQQLIKNLGTALGRSGIDHALTGAAGASLIAPFVTALPVVEIWVASRTSPEELYEATGAERVTTGQNLVFLQAGDDSPLVGREKEKTKGLWVADRFQVYFDLRNDPRRGREQADHWRREVIGF